ncbi:MAG: DoxX family protein [Anaerolineae bacterium]|nr:DoxX family protein [Anaerolineae bacterium]
MLSKTFGNNASIVPLLLRIGAGLTFLFAGIAKLNAPPVGFFGQIGIPAPEIMAPFIAILETVGGLMLLLGFGTRLAALLLACTMVVAILAAKMGGQQGLATLGLPNGWNAVRIEVMLLLACLALLFTGPGSPSVERNVMKRELL